MKISSNQSEPVLADSQNVNQTSDANLPINSDLLFQIMMQMFTQEFTTSDSKKPVETEGQIPHSTIVMQKDAQPTVNGAVQKQNDNNVIPQIDGDNSLSNILEQFNLRENNHKELAYTLDENSILNSARKSNNNDKLSLLPNQNILSNQNTLVDQKKLADQNILHHLNGLNIPNLTNIHSSLNPQSVTNKENTILSANVFENSMINNSLNEKFNINPSNPVSFKDGSALHAATGSPLPIAKNNKDANRLYLNPSLMHTQSADTALQSAIANRDQNASVVFSQLGDFINKHTAPEMSPVNNHDNDTPVFNNANIHEANNKALFTEAKGVSEDLLNIELTSINNAAMIKQSYDAKIKIHPPELGPLTAKLSIENNTASLMIITDNSRVKAIVESNLPQLHEHFRQADITLQNIQVQTSSTFSNNQDYAQGRGQQSHSTSQYAFESVQTSPAEIKSESKDPNNIIDTYA